jgi:hypothetical protein
MLSGLVRNLLRTSVTAFGHPGDYLRGNFPGDLARLLHRNRNFLQPVSHFARSGRPSMYDYDMLVRIAGLDAWNRMTR